MLANRGSQKLTVVHLADVPKSRLFFNRGLAVNPLNEGGAAGVMVLYAVAPHGGSRQIIDVRAEWSHKMSH
jgi:hypothetical protein